MHVQSMAIVGFSFQLYTDLSLLELIKASYTAKLLRIITSILMFYHLKTRRCVNTLHMYIS